MPWTDICPPSDPPDPIIKETDRLECDGFPDYDPDEYEVAEYTDCASFPDYSGTQYSVTEITSPAPCLCIPDGCRDPGSKTWTATISSDCPAIDGVTFTLTYAGTNCQHIWTGSASISLGACDLITATIRCGCHTMTGEFTMGTRVLCPADPVSSTFTCNPPVVTVFTNGICRFQNGPTFQLCGDCAITITITLDP